MLVSENYRSENRNGAPEWERRAAVAGCAQLALGMLATMRNEVVSSSICSQGRR